MRAPSAVAAGGRLHAREPQHFASGLYKPFGIAFYPPGPSPQYLYVAENHRVVRYPYTDGMIAAASAPEVVVSDLPQGAGRLPGKGHWTRDVAFSGDGTTMFVSIGSFSNNQEAGEDETNRARSWPTIPTAPTAAWSPGGCATRYRCRSRRSPARCGPPTTSATSWGTIWCPTSSPPCSPASSSAGPGTISAPISIHGIPNAAREGLPPAGIPNVLLQAHTASLGSTFYTGAQFPAEYHGSLFVAAHGSWNRAEPVGGKVIRLVFDAAGNALPYYEDFMTGFAVEHARGLGPAGRRRGGRRRQPVSSPRTPTARSGACAMWAFPPG